MAFFSCYVACWPAREKVQIRRWEYCIWWNQDQPALQSHLCVHAEVRDALSWQRQGHQRVHVADGEQPWAAAQRALVPVGVDPIGEDDDVALAEVQLALPVRVEGVYRPATGLIQGKLTVSWGNSI